MDRALPTRSLLAYAVPICAISYLLFFVQSYFLKFSTDVLLVSPTVVSILFGVAKLWDGISAPLIGSWSDRTRVRFGRRRTFLICSLPLLALGFVMLWTVPRQLEGVTQMVWLGAALLIFFTAVDLYAVPHFALGTALSSDSHDRTRIFALRQASFTVGILLAFAGIQLTMNASDQRHAATLFALATALASACLLLLPPLALSEPTYDRNIKGRGTWHALLDVGSMRAARRFIAVNFIEAVGTGAVAAMGPYVAEYIVRRPDIATLPPAAYVIAGVISLPVWVRVSRSYGKREIWRIAMILAALAFGGLWFIGEGDVALLIALLALAGAAMGAGGAISSSFLADVIDLDARRSGERKEGMYAAVNALTGKIGTALAIAISGPILSGTGFVPNHLQTDTALLGIRVLFAGLPCVGFLIGIWVFRGFSLEDDAQPIAPKSLAPTKA